MSQPLDGMACHEPPEYQPEPVDEQCKGGCRNYQVPCEGKPPTDEMYECYSPKCEPLREG
jgi:hypothetical protein